VVTDETGSPVTDVFVTVSTDFCIPDRTDAEGTFTVGRVSAGTKRLVTYGETAANGLFASISVSFDADGPYAFEAPVVTPRLDEVFPIDTADPAGIQIDTMAGLSLTASPGALQIAPLAPSEIQVARAPLDTAMLEPSDGSELVDLFVLHPILSTIDPPATVAFPSDLGLPEGTRVVFHALDYDLGELVQVAGGSVGADGRPTTDPGTGIPELTWIGISLEESP